MRIALVNMPWATTDVPSLALGILATRVHETFAQAGVQTIQANLDYVDWASEKIGLDGAEYSFFAEASYFSGCGDWVFSSALYGDRNWRVAEFEQSMAPGLPEYRRDVARKLHELAPDAVEHLVAIILDKNPDIVGFTSTFQQNTASLAAARRIKELAPQVTTVLGEGEAASPALLASRAGDGAAADSPGLCYRAGDVTPAANPRAARPIEP